MVAQMSLCIGNGDVKGDRVDLRSGQFGTEQNKANLGSIPVGHHHLPARFDQVGNVAGGFHQGLILIGDRLMSLVSNQRISPDGHHGEAGRGHLGCLALQLKKIIVQGHFLTPVEAFKNDAHNLAPAGQRLAPDGAGQHRDFAFKFDR